METIQKIYDNDYSVTQYYKKGWKCILSEDETEVPMTLVVEVINMYDATGEGEFKDFPVLFSIGILNKNINENLKNNLDIEDGSKIYPDDVIGHYGLNCYLEQMFLDTDKINKNLMSELKIDQACLYDYDCRFTGETKQFLKFKTEELAFNFAEKLILEYGDTFMTLIGFHLDKPINLMGETAWKQTEDLERGL